MSRTIAFVLVLLALIAVLVWVTHVSAVKSDSPTGYRPLAGSEFVSLSPSVGAGEVRSTSGVQVPQSSEGSSALPSALPAPTTAPGRTPTPKPSTRPHLVSGPSVAGIATWWDSWGHGFYAAAGPRLRAAMGDYLGRVVQVCHLHSCIAVKLTTSCACQPDSRIIDLSLDAFSRLADPSLGLITVEVSW